MPGTFGLIYYPGSDVFAVDLSSPLLTGNAVFSCSNCQAKGISYISSDLKQFADHMGREHHTPVILPGHTINTATARFIRRCPEALTCEDCAAKKAPWTRALGYIVGKDASGNRSIMCLKCRFVSSNPTDVEQKYCGNCHTFLDPPADVKQAVDRIKDVIDKAQD